MKRIVSYAAVRGDHLLWLGFGLAFAYWIVEAYIDSLFGEGSFSQRVIPADSNEIWMRLVIMWLIVAFSWFARYNVRQQRRAQQALSDAEKQYRGIFEHALEGIFQISPDGQLITANPMLAQILGYESPRELLNSVPRVDRRIFVDQEQCDALQKRMELVGSVSGFELQLYRRDGSVIWTKLHLTTVRDEQGRQQLFEGLLEDVTTARQIEVELTQQRSNAAMLARADAVLAATSLDLSVVLNTVVRHIADELGDVCALHLRSNDDKELALKAIYDRTAIQNDTVPILFSTWPTSSDAPLLQQASEAGHSIHLGSVVGERNGYVVSPQRSELCDQLMFQYMVVAPLMLHGNETGMLTVARRSELKPFTVSEQRLIEGLAYRAALAIEKAKLYQHAANELAARKLVETQLRGANTMLHTIIESSPLAIMTFGPTGLLTSWNRAAERMFHWRSKDVLGQRPLLENVHDWPDFRALSERVLQGETFTDVEIVYQRRDVSNINIRVAAAPLYDENNQILGAITLVSDITEEKRAAAALTQANERLAQLHTIDRAILAARSPQEIAQTALAHLHQLVPSEYISVAQFDLDAGQARVLAAAGSETALRLVGQTYPLSDQNLTLLRQDRMHVIPDIGSMTHLNPILQTLADDGMRAVIRVPLIVHGELIGSLNLAAVDAKPWTPEQLEIVSEIADQIAIALQHARLFEQIQAASARLGMLSRQLLDVQENERRSVARELHDEIGQMLTALKINLQVLGRTVLAGSSDDRLDESIAIVEDLVQQVRTLSLELRPSMLDDLGLASTMRWYTDRVSQRTGIHVRLHPDPDLHRAPTAIETAAFRVTQEALNNIIKHAQAQHVTIDLWQSDTQLILAIQDDGVGFDVDAAMQRAVAGSSMGLLNMAERVGLVGGQFSISSGVDGTRIDVSLPLTVEEEAERAFDGHTRQVA